MPEEIEIRVNPQPGWHNRLIGMSYQVAYEGSYAYANTEAKAIKKLLKTLPKKVVVTKP